LVIVSSLELWQAAAAVLALLSVVVLVRGGLRRRALARRLAAVATRLEAMGPGEVHEGHGVEGAVARLDRAVDERLAAHTEATEASARLAAALDHVEVGVMVWDDHGRLVFANHGTTTFPGGRHGEALADQALSAMVQRALAGQGDTQTLDLFGPPRRTLVLTTAPLDDERRSIGAVAVIEDVSGRRRLEAVRRDFVANISHELKTPVGALGLLAETLAGERDRAVVERLSTRMHEEALRVGRIIEDLLDLSRIEAEETPAREPVPVHLMVAQAAERVRSLADHRGIALDTDDPPRRLTVLGDRRQLVSAVHNLLENAVKYSDAGSSVELRVVHEDDQVQLVVRDSGIGIPGRDLERIFERFYRVDRARSRDTGGTGLGLAIVRHVAANHGGEVTVESQEGEGSVFTLRLPAGPRAVTISAKAG
jgi:two-component system sensor histidine kinase SenX3